MEINHDESESEHPSFSQGRKVGIVFHLTLSVLAAMAVTAMINYLAHRHTFRFYASGQAAQSLSPFTLQVLNSLTNQVKVIVFFDRTEVLFSPVASLLKEYQARSPRIDLEFVDYRLPGRAEAVRNEYKLATSSDSGKIIFNAAGKVRTVMATELSDYGMGTNREIRRTAFKGEQMFTSAILNVIQPRPVIAYLTQGHGEHSPENEDDQRGLSRFASLLTQNNIDARLLPPLMQGEVPKDCDLLIIAGPEKPFAEVELRAIQAYLAANGRALVMFNAASLGVNTGLEQLLAQWDLAIGQDWVQDRAQSQAGESAMLVTRNFGPHPTVRPLASSSLSLVMPRSVRHRPRAQSSPDSPRVVELAYSSSNGRRLVPRGNGFYPVEEGQLAVMAAAEKGSIQGVAQGTSARIVVTGDSLFLANLAFGAAGNSDFGTLALNWLCNRDALVSEIAPSPVSEYEIRLTEKEMSQIKWLLLGAIPGGVMAVGLLVWARRRA